MPPSGKVRMVLRTTSKPQTEHDMTTDKKVARRKLSLLELASDLGNVSKACRVMGYSRQQFYEIRRNFQTYGADGLLDRLPGADKSKPDPQSRLTYARHRGSCQPITISVQTD